MSATAVAAMANVLRRPSNAIHTRIRRAKLSSRRRRFIRLIAITRSLQGDQYGGQLGRPVKSSGGSWAAGGTGRRARLRGVWGNPSEFESRVAHQHGATDPTLAGFDPRSHTTVNGALEPSNLAGDREQGARPRHPVQTAL